MNKRDQERIAKHLHAPHIKHPGKSKEHHMGLSVQRRREMERAIVARVIIQALQRGYCIAINNGGEKDEVSASTDHFVLFQAAMASDSDRMTFLSEDKKYDFGTIHFVYGSSGYDVISDHTANDRMRELVLTTEGMAAVYETEAIHAK